MPHGYSMDDKSSVSFGEPKSPMDRIMEYKNIKKIQESSAGGGYMASSQPNSIFGNGYA